MFMKLKETYLIIIEIILLTISDIVFGDTNGVWINVEDIRPEESGGNELVSGDYIFNDNVVMNSNLNVSNINSSS